MTDVLRVLGMVLGAGMLLYAAYQGVDAALVAGASLLIGFSIGRTATNSHSHNEKAPLP